MATLYNQNFLHSPSENGPKTAVFDTIPMNPIRKRKAKSLRRATKGLSVDFRVTGVITRQGAIVKLRAMLMASRKALQHGPFSTYREYGHARFTGVPIGHTGCGHIASERFGRGAMRKAQLPTIVFADY